MTYCFTKQTASNKFIAYTSQDGENVELDYEDCDTYNDLLHTDYEFAQLTIHLSELMKFKTEQEWRQQFELIEDYLHDKNKLETSVGMFRVR